MVGLLVVIAIFLMVVGHLDLSHIRERAAAGDDNGYDVPDIITRVEDNFQVRTPLQLPASAEDALFYHEEGGLLELPIIGATGWVAAASALHASASHDSEEIADLPAGTAFTILSDSGDWWRVQLPDSTIGWVDWRRCFINLPDVLPSIVYNITNANASQFRSSGFDLMGITGQPLYSARAVNDRLNRSEYIVPAMFPLARALHNAQQAAHEIGHTLVIYEAFRPQSAQTTVVNALTELMQNNATANSAFADSPWSLIWFMPSGTSNHQRGGTIAASLARINNVEILQSGNYSFLRFTNPTVITSVTRVHEMSPASAILDAPWGILANQIINETVTMTGPAITDGIAYMQKIFAAAGMTPLASMWWHFDHSPSINLATSAEITGNFYTPTIYSIPPAR